MRWKTLCNNFQWDECDDGIANDNLNDWIPTQELIYRKMTTNVRLFNN